MRAPTFVVRAPGEPERVGRTLRALAAVGIAAHDCGGELARALDRANGPVWLVQAGAWLAGEREPADPPPSATGRPLVALGGVRPGRAGESAAKLPSIYLDPEPAAELARRLIGGMPFDRAAAAIADDAERWRVVRYAPLDVCFDPGLRVVQVVTSLQRGGAERVTLDLAVALGWHGVSSGVIVLGRTARQALALPGGLPVVDLSCLGADRTARAQAVGQAARRFAADVIHAHLLDAEETRIVAAAGIPLVVTVHNQRPGWPAGLERLAAGDAALLVGCARAVEAELVAAKLPVPARTAWNGIDPAAFASSAARRAAGRALRRRMGLARRDFVLLALANPRPQKRLDRLPGVLAAVRAALGARGSRRQAGLLIAGEVSTLSASAQQAVDAVHAEAARFGVTRHVRWAGSIGDVAAVLAASDVLVSTSDHEGLSLAQLEALAAGVPVVSTDAGGVAEICPSDPAVAVVPPDGVPRTFAALVADRAEVRIPVTLPAHFTRATMAARYAWLYPRAIASARGQQAADGVLLVTNNFSIGGAQSSARRLLQGLAARGVRVRAVVLQEDIDRPTPGRRALTEAGIAVAALPPAGSVDPAVAVARLLGLADDDPPAAVLLWNVIPEYRVLIADGLLRTPLFDVSPGALSFDALDQYFTRPRPGLPYRTAAQYGARLAGAIVKYQAEAPRAAATLGVPVHVIPNGVPVDPTPRGACGARVVIGTAVRINPQKRLDVLLEAVRRAHPRLPPYVVRVAGGVERGCEDHAEALRTQADGLPIEWLGGLEETTRFLREIDLFALVAEPAGCPNASLEAMAAGLAVVATDAGGMAEQVEDGVTGRLVGRHDVDALANALVEAAHDAKRRAAWGDAARQRIAQRFSLDRMVAEYARACLQSNA